MLKLPVTPARHVVMFSPCDFGKIETLSAHLNLWLIRQLHMHWHRR
jgi:hypothetical protein